MLLEVLVAVSVLGFLILGLTQSTPFGLSAWTVQTRLSAFHEDIGATERLMRGLIERTDPGDDEAPPVFAGLPGALRFRTTLPPATTADGFRAVDAGLGVDAAHRLVLRLVPNPAAIRLTPAVAREEILLEGVDRLELAYWMPPERDNPGRWVRAWNAPVLPPLIRMDLVFTDAERRHWPRLVAAPLREAIRR
jgi:general secretion pathway protein J